MPAAPRIPSAAPSARSAVAFSCISSSAVSIPSRLIIRSVNRNTPMNAAVPGFTLDCFRCVSMSPFIARPLRHMCTTIQVTGRAGGDDRQRSVEPFLVEGSREPDAADSADRDRDADAPIDRRRERRAAGFTEVREADRDDQEGFESFAEGDDERLEHVCGRSCKMRLILRIGSPVYFRDIRPVKSAIWHRQLGYKNPPCRALIIFSFC